MSARAYLSVGSRLSVDTLYREFVLTVQQIVDMFGADNCPAQVRDGCRAGGLENEFVIAHDRTGIPRFRGVGRAVSGCAWCPRCSLIGKSTG